MRNFRRAITITIFVASITLVSAQTYYWGVFAGLPPQYGSLDGAGAQARFNAMGAIAVDPAGNLYLADTNNGTIRRITPEGVVSTLAGRAGQAGSTNGTSENARFYQPVGIAYSQGNLFVAEYLNHAIRRVTLEGVVTTYAGRLGQSGSADGAASDARFFGPSSLTADSAGNLYVADSRNNVIRKISVDGIVTTIAGLAGSVGSADGVGAVARFYQPQGIAVDSAGILYVSDTGNHTIRMISTDDEVTTLAGKPGVNGAVNGTGSTARFRAPGGLLVLPDGSLLVADGGNYCLRLVSPSGAVSLYAGRLSVQGFRDGDRLDARFFGPVGLTATADGGVALTDAFNFSVRKIAAKGGEVSTLAGPGGNFGREDGQGASIAGAARFNFTTGVAVHESGDVYVSDSRGNTIRRIASDGNTITVAGSGTNDYVDGPAAVASVNYPYGVAVAPDRTVYFCEQQLHTIRVLHPDGSVATIAGSQGLAGNADGIGAEARFHFPAGIARDTDGNLFVVDTYNHAIRKITAGTSTVTTFAGAAGVAGSADGSGSAARFSYPSGLCLDAGNNLYVADTFNATIRKITPAGVVTTVAGASGIFGTTNGDISVARFADPEGIAVDENGRIFVAEPNNHVIRLIAGGTVSTIGGTTSGGGYADGTGGAAKFLWPRGVAVDRRGALYVADAGNNLIVKGSPAPMPSATGVARLTNLAIRSVAGTGSQTLIVGLTVGGAGTSGTKPLLVRGVGPSLGMFAVPGALADPVLTFYRESTALATSDNWNGDAEVTTVSARVGAFPLSAPTSRDAAFYNPGLTNGSYSIQLTGANAATGVALAEIYDATPASVTSTSLPRLVNVSARTQVGAGADILIAGFTIGGSGAKRVLIRAVGPGLAKFGVTGVLADPKLEVFSGATKIYDNDNWTGSVESSAEFVGAFALPAGSRDAGLLVTLPAGSYSAQVSGVGGTTGVALVEVYEVP